MISVDKMKSFVLHEEGIIREHAVKYFTEGNVQGVDKTEIMNLALQSCDMYKEQESHNRLVLSYAKDLPQTPETIAIIIDRLKEKKEINIWYFQILDKVDPRLLEQYVDDVSKFISVDAGERIVQRLHLVKEDTDTLWKELIEFGDSAAGKYVNEFNYSYGQLLVRELVNREDLLNNKILDTYLSYDLQSYNGYTNIYLIKMLGERRIEEAVPSLLNVLNSEGDLDIEVAAKALVSIGTLEVISKIKERFSREEESFRLFAAGVLGKIKRDESEQAILRLLPKEEDGTIITVLADGLCELVSEKGIPVVKKYIDDNMYDKGLLSLEESLYVTCIMTETNFPELQQWKNEIHKEKSRILGADESLIKSQPVVREQKVGRNDPCPCGSGKKYKKCCANK